MSKGKGAGGVGGTRRPQCLELEAARGLHEWEEVFFSHGAGLLTAADLVRLLQSCKAWSQLLSVYVRPQRWLCRALGDESLTEDLEEEEVAAAEGASCFPQLSTSLQLIYTQDFLQLRTPIPPRRLRLLRLALPWFLHVTALRVECDVQAAKALLCAWREHAPPLLRLRSLALKLYDEEPDEERPFLYEEQIEPALRELLRGVQDLRLEFVQFGARGVGGLWPAPGPVPPLSRLTLKHCTGPQLWGEAFERLAPTLEVVEVYQEGNVAAAGDGLVLPVGALRSVCWPRLRYVVAGDPLPPRDLVALVRGLGAEFGTGLQWESACTPVLRSYELGVATLGSGAPHEPGQERLGRWEAGLLAGLHRALCPLGGVAPGFLKLRLYNVDLWSEPGASDLAALWLLRPLQLTLVDRGPLTHAPHRHPAGRVLAQQLGRRPADNPVPRLGLKLALRTPALESKHLRAWAGSYQRLLAAALPQRGVPWGPELSFESFTLAGYLPWQSAQDLPCLIQVQREAWRFLCALGVPLNCRSFWLLDKCRPSSAAPRGGSAEQPLLPRHGLRGGFSLVREFLSPAGEAAYGIKDFRLFLAPSEAEALRRALRRSASSWELPPNWLAPKDWAFLVCSGTLGSAAPCSGDHPLALLLTSPGHALHGYPPGYEPICYEWPYKLPWFADNEARRLLLGYVVLLIQKTEEAASAELSSSSLHSGRIELELRKTVEALSRAEKFRSSAPAFLSGYVLERGQHRHQIRALALELARRVETALSLPHSAAFWADINATVLAPLRALITTAG